MKSMRFVAGLLTFVIIFLLVGCGRKEASKSLNADTYRAYLQEEKRLCESEKEVVDGVLERGEMTTFDISRMKEIAVEQEMLYKIADEHHFYGVWDLQWELKNKAHFAYVEISKKQEIRAQSSIVSFSPKTQVLRFAEDSQVMFAQDSEGRILVDKETAGRTYECTGDSVTEWVFLYNKQIQSYTLICLVSDLE